MVADLARSGLGVAMTPVKALTRMVRRGVTGPRCVLDVDVGRLPDVRARQQWLRRLRRTAADPAIKGVLLRFHGVPGRWAATGDLRSAIASIRGAGTPVYAAVESPGTGVMWAATACDHVFCAPTGQVALLGVGAELTFFGGALEQLGVQPDFEAAGAYKSFGESYTRRFASPENQEAIGAIVDDLQAMLVREIAADRGLEEGALRLALARAPLSASEAVEAGLVDTLAYEDQLRDWLKEAHGKGVRLVAWAKWARVESGLQALETVGEIGAGTAVVYLDGPIVMDRAGRGSAIRARKVVEVLRGLRNNPRIGAVVLCVNSPGGSALASDLIWREAELLLRKKALVAYFEDVAASGGYYLAAPATEIVLRRGTLTGSIGVFGGKLVLSEGFRKLGVHTQQIPGAPNAHLYSPSRPFDPDQRSRFRQMLERTYGEFVQRVAAGRNVPQEQVEPACRGRVWTGGDAVEQGLADRFGGLDDAIERARSLAGLPLDAPVLEVSTLPKLTAVQWAVQRALPSGARALLPPLVAQVGAVLGTAVAEQVSVLLELQGQAMAMLPFDLDLR